MATHDLQNGGHRLGAVAVVGVRPRLLHLHAMEVLRAVRHEALRPVDDTHQYKSGCKARGRHQTACAMGTVRQENSYSACSGIARLQSAKAAQGSVVRHAHPDRGTSGGRLRRRARLAPCQRRPGC